jgi:hypothetical protein
VRACGSYRRFQSSPGDEARCDQHFERVAGDRRCFNAEHEKGSLETGKLADLVVRGADLSAVPPDEVRDGPVDMTISGGRVVYER